MKRVVVALGGNALLRRGEPAEAETQKQNAVVAAAAIGRLAGEYELVVTHGNGPQVGLLALEAQSYEEVTPYPLDVLGAESQGMIGYVLAQALANEAHARVGVVVTQVVVDPGDPAFAKPTKPIGPVYDLATASQLAAEHGWCVARDGRWYRRVVPSPFPQRIVELQLIERLAGDGAVVLCCGGGGIPVVERDGQLVGVEAVIDKDLTAALLAESIGAHRLVIVTDVENVVRDWGTDRAAPIGRVSPRELRGLEFAPGSMEPKVRAACAFVERTGGTAAIGALDELEAVARGDAGTQIAAGYGRSRAISSAKSATAVQSR